MGGDWIESGAWERLQWWHPARLLGFDLRRWEYYSGHPMCREYARSKRVARDMLHSTYGEKRHDAPSALLFD